MSDNEDVYGCDVEPYVGTDRVVRWSECYKMRKDYKRSVCDEFSKIEDRLKNRDIKIEKTIDQVYEKMDKLYMIAFGILASILGGIGVGVIMYILP